MKTFDTIYIINEDGSATWFSPEASQTEVATQSNDVAKSKVRKVVRAQDGYILKLGNEVVGTQMWLKDGILPECLTEVKAEEVEDELEENADEAVILQ